MEIAFGQIQFIKKTTGRKRLLSTALHKRCEYLYRTNKQGNIFYSLQLNYGIMLLLTPDHAEKQCQQACSFKSFLYNSGIKDKTCSVSKCVKPSICKLTETAKKLFTGDFFLITYF